MKAIRVSPAYLVSAALKLEPRSRAEVAQRLLESLEELSAAERENLWLAEAARRDDLLDRGELQSIPAQEVFARLRSRLK